MARKRRQGAQKHHLVHFGRRLGVPCRVAAPAEGGAPMYRRNDVPKWRVLRVLARNAEIAEGGREEVGAGAAGRCGVGVWYVVCGCVLGSSGGGFGAW